MKDKKTLAKLAVTGLLLAANMPAAMQAEVGREVYMAVAGCGADCRGGGGKVSDSASDKAKSRETKPAEEVAEAEDTATPEKSGYPFDPSRSKEETGTKTHGGSNGNSNTPTKK